MSKLIDSATIVARCKQAGVNNIYKSYIHNIRLVDCRKEADWFMEERDFTFTHKENKYIIRSEIVGDKRYSAVFRYKLDIIGG